MAKFLPFIVKKSSPLRIYQTLISRSKGLNSFTVTSLFYLIIDKGIETVRKDALEFPEGETGVLYDSLLNKHSDYRISSSDFKQIHYLAPLVKKYALDKISQELVKYEIEDIMNFLLVMFYTKQLEEYTELIIGNLFNGKPEDVEKHLTSYKLFSDKGKEVYFVDRKELSAYIHFETCILPAKEIIPIKAVLMPKGFYRAEDKTKYTQDDEDLAHDY